MRAHATARGLLVGCAVDVAALKTDEDYAGLVKDQANILVGENAMKWDRLRPTIDNYDFGEADELIAFAEANKMRVRGHTLCWHRQLPKWFAAEAHEKNARELLTEHIKHVAGRYAGRMHSWDVVNEAVNVEDGRPDGLRDSPWLRLVGEGYIEAAFHAARAADAQALLTLNEFGIEGEDRASEKKRVALLALLRRMKARDVPVDAVGVQSHLNGVGQVFGAGLEGFREQMQELGLQVLITEMDVNDRELAGNEGMRDKVVAAVYRRYLDAMLKDANVTAVVTWGITDRRTWLNGENQRADELRERCLPFDAESRPVGAFFAMRDSVDKRTKTEGYSRGLPNGSTKMARALREVMRAEKV